MQVSILPEDLIENNVKIRIYYHAEKIHNHTIVVHGSYSIKNDRYNEKDYNYLKYFFKTIVEKFNEKIILERATLN